MGDVTEPGGAVGETDVEQEGDTDPSEQKQVGSL